MTVLTKEEILKEIKKGRVRIKPFDIGQVGPASIDLTLGDEFRILAKNRTIKLEENTSTSALGKVVVEKKGVALEPGQFLLSITREKVSLPDDICGLLTGRSRFARTGLAIHATAAFIQPGISNKQVLEIKNLSDNTLVLEPGLRICQLILLRTEGKARYNGRYARQLKIPR